MKLYLNNVGIIKDSEIQLDGLTVITGKNSSGKTTVGRALYSLICAGNNTVEAFEDARRRYVFSAIYDEKNNIILKPQHIKMDDLNKELEKLSDYTIITKDELEEYDNKEDYSPNIMKIIEYFKDKESINPHGVNPDYLKLTEAEESKLN